MFGLGSGCETSCLTEKCLDVCIGGKFQFSISLFTVFDWSLTAALNAMVIFNYISKKKSCCLEVIVLGFGFFFSEIKSTLKYPNKSLNSKPVIIWQSLFLRSISRSDLLLMSQHLLQFLLETEFCWHRLTMSNTKYCFNLCFEPGPKEREKMMEGRELPFQLWNRKQSDYAEEGKGQKRKRITSALPVTWERKGEGWERKLMFCFTYQICFLLFTLKFYGILFFTFILRAASSFTILLLKFKRSVRLR